MGCVCIDDSRNRDNAHMEYKFYGPHEEFITAGPCDHGRWHDGNGTSTLASTKEQTPRIVSLCAFICNYIVIIIKYVIVWPFLVVLLKY